MRATLIFSALAAVAVAAPFSRRDTWAPLPGTTATCGDAEFYMSLVIGPESAETVPKHSCAAFMPTCAYPTEASLGPDVNCTGVATFPLDSPKNVTLPVLVEKDGNKMSQYAVNFFVVPKVQGGRTAVQWTTADCEGYINELVQESDPKGCNSAGKPGPGNLTIGAPINGSSSLTGTIVGAKIVKK